MSEDARYYDEVAAESGRRRRKEECPKLPGTLLRIFIPAGAVINILNLLELRSPSGICLLVRIPALGGLFHNVLDSVKQAGGTVEFVYD